MSKYKSMELSDILDNPDLDSTMIEVIGVPRGIGITTFEHPTNPTAGFERPYDGYIGRYYHGMLQQDDLFLMFSGMEPSHDLPLYEMAPNGLPLTVALLRAASETERPVALRGIILASMDPKKHAENIAYDLKVQAVEFNGYEIECGPDRKFSMKRNR